jgi:SAM-dependent methyltransferase
LASIKFSPGNLKFGEDPAAYDFARPTYPPELFDWLRERCRLGAGSECFEIGAGTGHGTLPVLALPVRRVLAIEPDARLADVLAGKAPNDPRLDIRIALFEDAGLPPAHFDFAFAAMSIHWMARMKAFAKVHAALKPGGWFAMWWSVYHDNARPDAFGAATEHLFKGLEQDSSGIGSRAAFALDFASRLGELRSAGFVEVDRKVFTQTIDFTPQRLSSLYATFSRVRMAPEETSARLLSEVERIASEDFKGAVKREIPVSAFIGRKPG